MTKLFKLTGILLLAICAAPLFAQSVYNLDDVTSGWQLCSGSCAGGNSPTSTTQTFGNSSPSKDGGSMLLSMNGNAGTNNGWYYDTGAQDNASSFTLDTWVYVPTTSGGSNCPSGGLQCMQALEFDQFQYLLSSSGQVTNNTRLYFGTECIMSSVWKVWDSSGIGWVSTGQSCNITTANTWHHLVIKVHRLVGDNSCSGYPCMYYDSIAVDGVTTASSLVTNGGALPSGWSEQTGTMVQMDTNSTCGSSCTVSEYFDLTNFTIGSNLYVDPNVSSSANTGVSPSAPWKGISQINWSTVNSSLATGPTTIYFSATSAAHTANTVDTTALSIDRTDTSSNLLTLDFASLYNNNDSSPSANTWVTNTTLAPGTCVAGTQFRCAATASWATGFQYQIGTSSAGVTLPISSNATYSNCIGYITIQGLRAYRAEGQAATLNYMHDLTFQYNHISGIPSVAGSYGPGIYAGPGNNGPCQLSTPLASGTVNTSGTAVTWVSGAQFTTGNAWVGTKTITINGTQYNIASVGSATSIALSASAGTQSGVAYSVPQFSGPDNVTIQYNDVDDTFEDLAYLGASTSDPPGGPGNAEYEGSISGHGLTCGTACPTGANYVIQFNTLENSATPGGGENQCIDMKDGHMGTALGLAAPVEQYNTCRPTLLFASTSVSGVTGTESSTTATLTDSAAWPVPFHTGLAVYVSGCSVSGYNGVQSTAVTVSGTHLSYTAGSSGLGSTTGCTVIPLPPGGPGFNNESCGTIWGNYFDGPATQGIGLHTGWNNTDGRSSCDAENNIIVNAHWNQVGDNSGVHIWNDGGGQSWVNLLLYNNTFYNDNVAYGGACVTADSGSYTGTMTVQNSVISTCGTGGTSGTITTHSYNDYHNTGASCPGETGAQCGDPLFDSTTPPYVDTGFELQPTSPVIGEGTNLYSQGVTTDYFGNSLPSSGNFTMGAAALPTLAAPTCSPGNGTYNQSVTITCTLPSGATGCVAYSPQVPAGSNGVCSTPTYTGTITLSGSATLNILATESGFSNSPTSSYAYNVTVNLTVTVSGSGSVSSSPSGISCPSTCTASFQAANTVTLTATAGSGQTFVGWSGPGSVLCTGGPGICTLTELESNESITATFSPVTTTYTLTMVVNGSSGSGSVSSTPSGIGCPSVCSASFPAGTLVSLSAIAGTGYFFDGYTGGCVSSTTLCSFTINANTTVTATFLADTNAPIFTSAPSATFNKGAAGSFTLTATGNPSPSISLSSGSLPNGVTFAPTPGTGSGLLSGIPTVSGSFPLVFEAQNGVLPNGFEDFTLNVDAPPVFTTPNSVTFLYGVPNSFTATVTGYPNSQLSETGTLPAGVTFIAGGTSNTGILSGTPAQSGTFGISFTATSSIGSTTQPFTLTVPAPVTGLVSGVYTLNATEPPTTPSDTNYAAFQSVLTSGNGLFTGGTVGINSGCSKNCSQFTYIDSGTSFPVLSFAASDAVMATYTSLGKKANIILQASVEGGQNTGTSSYVFTQNWANLLDLDGSGNPENLTYTVGKVYRPLNYVLANGNYWQMTGTAADPNNTLYGIGCRALVQPAFTNGGGPYTESAPWPCTWTEVGASAPPQDVLCAPNYPGTNCYTLTISNAVASGGTATLTVANPPTYPVGQAIQVSGITTSGYTGLNGNWTMTGSTSTTVSFAFGSSLSSSPINSGATVNGTHLVNINTANATVALLASALPIAYEMPYSIWRNYLCDQTIQHYNSGLLDGGYMICGFEGNGEYSTFATSSQPMYGSASQFRSIWLSNISDFLAEQEAQNPQMTLYGDMNAVSQDYTYTDQECAMEVAHNMGCKTNGLQVNDITDILGTGPTPCDNPPVSITLGCTAGGWYHAFYTYPTLANGNPAPQALQIVSGSTPSNCTAGLSGPLGTLPAGATDCSGGFMGLLNALVELRTTGLVTSPSPITENVNNVELWTSGPAQCQSCPPASAYPVGDILFALDPTYSSTTYAQTTSTVLSQQIPYEAAFANYLTTPSVYGECPGPAQCATAVWTLGGNAAMGQLGPPLYLGSTNSTANPGAIAPIFTATAPTATTCSGMCQNATAYDSTLNQRGTDCITRITDGTVFPSGLSMGNLTFSGGDNDIMGSVNETYLGVNTGQVYILHMNTSGNCIQVVNTGAPAIHVAGPFGFSRVTDTRFYYIVSKTQLWEGDITSDTTWTKTELYDATGSTGGFTQCPGVNWSTFGTPTSGSIMGISQTDGRFAWVVAPGTQGTGDWAFVWDRALGCATVNFATGSYWTFCLVSCSSSTPASGTLSTAAGTCWGSLGSSSHGIHDSQMSGDGNYLQLTLQITGTSNVSWTQGSCAGTSSQVNQQTTWTINTATTQWSSDNTSGPGGLQSGAHYSTGVTHYVTPYFNGPNIRSLSNVTSFTQFAAPVVTADEHLAWPDPLGDDSYPWVGASDLTTAANGGCQAPTYLQNVIYSWFPNSSYPPGTAPRLFAHTFSRGASAADCPLGTDAIFGSQQSIGAVTQKGNFFCWASTHLGSLGNDNLGNPRADGFCVHLQ